MLLDTPHYIISMTQGLVIGHLMKLRLICGSYGDIIVPPLERSPKVFLYWFYKLMTLP